MEKKLSPFLPYLWITLACAVYALSFNWCFASNDISFGGLTGVAQIINHFIPQAPVGIMVVIFNIPLFVLAWRVQGASVLVRSVYAMTVSSLMIDGMTALWGSFAPMDPLLACIYGGILLGGALGVILQQSASTGGTDLLARLLKHKVGWLPIGQILMGLDLVIIVAAAFAFQQLNSALYGLIALYVCTQVIDVVLYGLDNAKVAYIISDHHREIIIAVDRVLDRGATILHGEGSYSGQAKRVLMVAFKQRQITELKTLVKVADPSAFVIVCDAHEVLGDGFQIHQDDNI